MVTLTRYGLIFLLLLFFLIAPIAQADNKVFVVGQAIDLSGPNGSIGRDYVAGITTYFDSVNANGGLTGRKIKYLVRDDQGNPALAVNAVTALLDIDKVDYVIGGVGAAVIDAVISAPAFARSGQVLFAPLIASGKDYGSRVMLWRPSVEQEMQYIFSYFEKLGIKSVGIALQDSPQQHDTYQYVVAEIRKRNMILSGVQFRKYAPRTFVAGTSLVNLGTLAEVAGPKAREWTVFSQVVPNPLGKKSAVQIDHSAMMKKFRDEAVSALTLEGFIIAKTLSIAMQMNSGGKHDGIQKLASHKGIIENGGLPINPSDPHGHLSNYLDMALFQKGGGLMF